jgi:hypothetical protein
MDVNVTSKVKLYGSCRAVLIFLLFFVVLFVSLFFVFNGVETASLEGVVCVKTESALRDAVNKAEGSTIIALDKDIKLTKPLIISANKDITLTSNRATNFFKLVGAKDVDIIIVEANGLLRLDGIIVTHKKNAMGRGVFVNFDGTLIMFSGEISNNIVHGCGGVYNSGTFTMSGGKIFNNKLVRGYGSGASNVFGGGVYTSGNFSMFDGEISNNVVWSGSGGGVAAQGSFSMSGGVIVNNTAYDGGGVFVLGSFEMSDGTISGNTASNNGSGVYNDGIFDRLGGTIINNIAIKGGDVYNIR